ncbi:hypothetical protein DFJ74DRAFT_514074 [Hyaloraphidium curvatum]|nr:hypothetical protein DFJ74DRAFT_514074 [Hyaloraphidium curvatum]
MLNLSLDGSGEPKPANAVGRRRRRERESVLLTRGEDGEIQPAFGPSSFNPLPVPQPAPQAEPAPSQKPAEPDSGAVYAGVKWQPPKMAAPARPRTSPLASVATSGRVNRDLVVGRQGLRSSARSLRSLAPSLADPAPAAAEPEPQLSLDIVAPEAYSSPTSRTAAPPSNDVFEVPTPPPLTADESLSKSEVREDARDDVYGFKSFEDAFITAAELDATREKLGDEEAQLLADPWARLNKWKSIASLGQERRESISTVLSEKATIALDLVSYGTGRLVLAKGFLEWIGLFGRGPAAGDDASPRTVFRFPCNLLLNLRRRPRPLDERDQSQSPAEVIISTEIEGSALQFGIGEGTEIGVAGFRLLTGLGTGISAADRCLDQLRAACIGSLSAQHSAAVPSVTTMPEALVASAVDSPPATSLVDNALPVSSFDTPPSTSRMCVMSPFASSADRPESLDGDLMVFSPTPPSRTVSIAKTMATEAPTSSSSVTKPTFPLLDELCESLELDFGTSAPATTAPGPIGIEDLTFTMRLLPALLSGPGLRHDAANTPRRAEDGTPKRQAASAFDVGIADAIRADFYRRLDEAKARRDAAIRKAEEDYVAEAGSLELELEAALASAPMAHPELLDLGGGRDGAEANPRAAEEQEDPICGLCCDAAKSKVLRPCNHALCESCLSRLCSDDGSVKCPWDRSDVTVEDLEDAVTW